MAALASIFLIVALALAILIGPQTRDWSWGPAMVALGIAGLASIPLIWMRKKTPLDLGVVALGLVVAGWFAVRAAVSPVPELGQADLFLLASAVASFMVIRCIEGNMVAERIIIWGIALLLLATAVVSGIQWFHPEFTPIFHSRRVVLPSGFFGHYNEGANFVIGCTLLVAGAAAFGQHKVATRVFLGILTIAGFTAVYLSRSRGGIFSACVAAAVFVVLAMVVAKQQNSRWFARLLIALPVIGLLIAGALFVGWEDAQQVRSGSADINRLLDNDIRLYLAGIAISCISLHPWGGGGSRSYSWESYRFWDPATHGNGQLKPDMVHNEALQAATDYGIIGIALLLVLLLTVAFIAIVRMSQGKPIAKDDSMVWRVGGLAALAGMISQSNFSFVFHLVPQVILLGVCLGFATRSETARESGKASKLVSKLLITGISALCVAALIPFGVKGTQVAFALWPSMFSKTPLTSEEARIDGLTQAIQALPRSVFYQERAMIYAAISKANGADWANTDETQKSLDDFTRARVLHPYDPSNVINQALMMSFLKQDAQAEVAFRQSVELQGGMESLFSSHFHFANHLYKRGLRDYQSGDKAKAVEAFQEAAVQIESALKSVPWNGVQLRLLIYESLGAAQEGTDDPDGALETYNLLSTINHGQTAHYRAGALLGKLAVQTWQKREPAEALRLFIEARERVAANKGAPPSGVTGAQRAEYIAYLDRTIKFLKDARITPAPSK